MADPLPDPRIDSISDVESSEDEVNDLFDAFQLKLNEDNHQKDKRSGDTQTHTQTTKSLKSNKSSKKSRKRSQKKDLVCNECQPKRYFKKQKILDQHKDILHKCGPEKVCLWCAKQFYTQNQLDIHQKLYFHDKPLD